MDWLVLAIAVWDTGAAGTVFELPTGPEATVSTTLVEVYETTKCSVE